MPEIHNPRLVLTPVDHTLVASKLDELINYLQQQEFISGSAEIVAEHRCYSIGENFLYQVSFLGCSPTLFSDDGDQDIFISIIEHSDVSFAFSSEIPPPRCPHCQKTDKSWRQYFQHWTENKNKQEICPNCGDAFSFVDMKWKKNGGYGKCFIQVHGVQENLAVPNPAFLQSLQQFTQTEWEYFFADN